MTITLDGPAGSGKSTISRDLAKTLGFNFLDTGATYRCVTLLMLENQVTVNDSQSIHHILDTIQIEFDQETVLINGVDRSEDIRSPEVDHYVSPVSKIKEVRDSMTRLQRQIAAKGDFVTEGRDMGTAVFPDAEYKFYLDADVKERARRRYEQTRQKGHALLSLDEIEAEIIRRDEIDTSRAVAPLRPARDAIIIDTSSMSAEQVTRFILGHIKIQK